MGTRRVTLITMNVNPHIIPHLMAMNYCTVIHAIFMILIVLFGLTIFLKRSKVTNQSVHLPFLKPECHLLISGEYQIKGSKKIAMNVGF